DGSGRSPWNSPTTEPLPQRSGARRTPAARPRRGSRRSPPGPYLGQIDRSIPLRAIHPWSEPKTSRERRGESIPTFKVDGDGNPDVRAQLHEALVAERRGFLGEHAEALEGWRAGDRSVSFPAGTYLMRALHGASVAPPHPGAILCAPDAPEASGRPNMDVV